MARKDLAVVEDAVVIPDSATVQPYRTTARVATVATAQPRRGAMARWLGLGHGEVATWRPGPPEPQIRVQTRTRVIRQMDHFWFVFPIVMTLLIGSTVLGLYAYFHFR